MDLNTKEKEEIINAISDNLAILRKQLNLSQQDLAEKLNISRQTITNIENHRSKMNWITAFSLLMFFVLNPATMKLLKPLGLITESLLNSSPILKQIFNFKTKW